MPAPDICQTCAGGDWEQVRCPDCGWCWPCDNLGYHVEHDPIEGECKYPCDVCEPVAA